jgi:hypothetical protein
MIDAEECRRQAASCEIEAITEDHDGVRTVLLSMARHWAELASQKDHLHAILSELDRLPELERGKRR